MNDKTTQGVVFGRVALPNEAAFDTSDHRVEAWAGGRRLASASTAEHGRFRLDVRRPHGDPAVDLRVFAPWGTEIERRTLSRTELITPHELLLRAALPPDILSPDGTGVPVPRVVHLVSDSDMDMFHAVTAIAAFGDHFLQAGGPLAEVDRIYEILVELDNIYRSAYGALRGDPRHIQSIKLRLEREPCFPNGHHDAPNDEPVDREKTKNYLSIEDADALPLAGVMLDSMDSDLKADEHTWAERARCYYLSRTAIIQRVFSAAASVAENAMEPEVFAAVLKLAAKPVHAEKESHDEEKPHLAVEQWDDATIRWAKHAKEIQDIAKNEINARDIPPLVDRVEPAAVAPDEAVKLTFFPAKNSRFPKRPDGNLDGILAYWLHGKRHLLQIASWTDDAIEAELPSGLQAGRGVIYWEAPSPPFTERILKPSPEPPPPDERVLAPYCVPGQIEVPVLIPYVRIVPIGEDLNVGERRVFTPGADISLSEYERFVSAESCTEVRLGWEGGLRWSAEPIIPSTPPTNVSVTILANGEVISTSASASGEIVADRRVSTRYEVRLEAYVGTVSLGTDIAVFHVDRYAQIRLEVADRVFSSTAPVPITVKLSCPPPPGLRVLLTSADASILASNSFIMPVDREYPTGLLPTGGIGAVYVTATAEGHTPARVLIHIGRRFGGEWHVAPIAPTVVGVHIAVLHTGKVLLFNYREGHHPVVEADGPRGQWLIDILTTADSNAGHCQLWDPATGEVTSVELGRNLFCSGHAFLSDGRLFIASGQFHVPVWVAPHALIAGSLLLAFRPELAALLPFIALVNAAAAAILAGGHNYDGADKDLHIFRPTESIPFQRLSPDMAAGRWYPTCVTLPDGKVMVISGTSGALARPIFGGIQDTYEIFDPMRPDARDLRQLGFRIRHLYPFMHVLPSGSVFLHYMRLTALANPPGFETFTLLNGLDGRPLETDMSHGFSRTGPGPGTSVLLPLLPTRDASTGIVRYPAGRILILGGGGAEAPPEPSDGVPGPFDLGDATLATNTAEILDFSETTPVWRPTASMANPRVMPDSVILPNGKILVVSGARRGHAGAAFGAHLGALGHEREPVLEPEMFDPVTETWESLSPMTIPRVYHATAALLPDGRVLVAGHDGLLNNYRAQPGRPPLNESKYQLEIFSPPYLFRGARPVIRAAPTTQVRYGSAFQIEIDTDTREIASVCLIRQSSVTHQINTDQRYVGLAIIPTMSRASVTAQAPPNANIAPPGFYMLFVVNRLDIPSVARWVQIA